MDKSELIGFLEAIDLKMSKHASVGEHFDLYLLGRSALILRFGLSLATKDVDLVTRGETSQLHAKAFELFGKGTPNAQKWEFYLEGVPEGLPPMPGRYRQLSQALPGKSCPVSDPR
ncbi:MAG: hypothetical protein HY040_03770 [Planctomycetes bacterium]|nr:hypothetical protein [Planctomycetota bacterium]